MTDNATPEPRNATGTPDGTTIDLLIDCYDFMERIKSKSADAMADAIRAHLLDLARAGQLFQTEGE